MEEIFGNYRLLDRIAVGGMAEVFRAKRVGAAGFEKTVALKRILPRYATQQEFVQMFTDEANIAAGLQHPNIAQVYDFGQVAGRYYIAMEFVEGWDLQKLLRALAEQDTCCAPDVAARIAVDILRGLGYAHAKCDARGRSLGIVHRDVTPGNMILSTAGVVKIVDFGIVKAKDKISRTRTGVLKGKSRYLAPEGVRGKSIDARSDLYQVGVILYELLTLHRVYDGGSDAEILQAIMKGQTVPVSSWVQAPDALDRAVMKALDGEPRRRWRTAEEFERALDDYLSSVGGASNDRVVQYARDTFHPALLTEPVKKRKSGLLQALNEEDRERISDALESGYNDELPPPPRRAPRRTPLFGHPEMIQTPISGSFESELGEVTRESPEHRLREDTDGGRGTLLGHGPPQDAPPGRPQPGQVDWSSSDGSQPSISGLVAPTFQLPVFVDQPTSSNPPATREMPAAQREREQRELGEETTPGQDSGPRSRTVLGLGSIGDVTAKRDLGELFDSWKGQVAEGADRDATRLGAPSHAAPTPVDLPSGPEMAQLARAAVASAVSRPAPVLATVVCRRCRRPTAADARFCNACGEPVANAAGAEPGRGGSPAKGAQGQSALGGRYEILQKLGDGPYGTVYLARQLSVKRPVALKVLHPQLADDPDVARLFSQEVQSAAGLRDPHTVVVHDFDRLPDHTLFVAMEYVEGQNLGTLRARTGAMELPLVVHIAAQILDALAEAHATGMVHGDVRPENILVCRRGEDAHFVKVTDFGMASLCQGKETLLEVADRPRPLAHLAPEVVAGRSPLRQSDLYSVGLLIWEMLTGLSMPPPTVRKGRLEPASALRLAPLDELAPAELIKTLDLVLSPDVARRPPTALRLKESLLRSIGQGSLGKARPVTIDPGASRVASGSIEDPLDRTVGPDTGEQSATGTAAPRGVAGKREPDTVTDQVAVTDAEARAVAAAAEAAAVREVSVPVLAPPLVGTESRRAEPEVEPPVAPRPVRGTTPPVGSKTLDPAVEPIGADARSQPSGPRGGEPRSPGGVGQYTAVGLVLPPKPKRKGGSRPASEGGSAPEKTRPRPSRKGPILIVLMLLLGALGYGGFWYTQVRGIALFGLGGSEPVVTPTPAVPPTPAPGPGLQVTPAPVAPGVRPPGIVTPPPGPAPGPAVAAPPVPGAPVAAPPAVAPAPPRPPAIPAALQVLTVGQPVDAVTWAKGTLVAGDQGGTLTRWNPDGDLKPTLGNHKTAVRAVMGQAQGGLLFSASAADLVAFDLDGGFERWRRAAPVVTAALSADGKTLAHADGQGGIHFWAAADGRPTHVIRHGAPVTALVFLPQGGLVTAGTDQQLRYWPAAPAPGVARAARLAPHGRILALAASPDGRWLASAGQDGLVRIWRLPDLAPMMTLKGHVGPVSALAIIGALVASGGADRLIRLWRIPDGLSLGIMGQHLDRITGLAFSPKRDSLLSGSADRTVRLWKLGP
jgi:serine/threonine protein kinase